MPRIDLHSHPSTSLVLFGDPSTNDGALRPVPAIFQRTVPDRLAVDGVAVAIASHSIPEGAVLDELRMPPGVHSALQCVLQPLFGVMEDRATPYGAYHQTLAVIDAFDEAARRQGALVPRTLVELQAAPADAVVYLHALEGAHHLGRPTMADDGSVDIDEYLYRLDRLLDAGVCMLQLAHLWPNVVASCVNGLPPSLHRLLSFPEFFDDTGLTVIGRRVVERMCAIGMVVDLSHTSPRAREQAMADIEAYNAEADRQGRRRRPIVFSHAGLRTIFRRQAPAERQWDYLLGVSDDDILRVHRSGGTIGLSMTTYWHCGREEGELTDRHRVVTDTFLASVRHIVDLTGSYHCISVGSDFDSIVGAVDRGAAAPGLSELEGVLAQAGFPAVVVDAIMKGNALRVLADGWSPS